MMDGGVEIGVVANLARKLEFDGCDRKQKRIRAALLPCQEIADRSTECSAFAGCHQQDSVQGGDTVAGSDIENLVADRYSQVDDITVSKCSKRQILNREIGIRIIRGFDPTGQ